MSTRAITPWLCFFVLTIPGAALAQPDLQLQGLSVYSTTVQRDGNRLVSVSFRVINGGTAAAAASVTRVGLNASRADLQTPRLQPGQVAFLSHFIRTTANPVKVVVTADVQQQVAERDEANNGLQYVADPVAVEDGRWQFLGPSVVRDANGSIRGVGRVTTLAIDPRTADTVYVGARGTGVWKTTDGGGTWFPVSDALPLTAIAAIAVDPVRANRVLMASSAGVFESQDGGSVWVQLTVQDLKPRGHDGAALLIQVVPEPVIATAAVRGPSVLRPEPVLYLSTDDGVSVSTDGGRNWRQVIGGGAVGSLQFRTGSTSLLFAALNGLGLFVGQNGGLTSASWHQLKGCPTAPLPAIPDNARVWVGSTGVTLWMSFLAGQDRHLFKSRSRACQVDGVSEFEWSEIPIDPSCNKEAKDNSSFLFLHPNNSRIVFKGGQFLCRSDAGAAPKKLTQAGLHVDQHSIAAAPSRPSTMYLGNDGGLYRSDDNGATWRFVSEGLGIAEYLDGSNAQNAAQVVGGSWDNGASAGNAAVSAFRPIGGGDVTSVAFERSDPTVIYRVEQSIQRILRVGTVTKNIADASVLPDCKTGDENGPTVSGQIVSTNATPPLVVACEGLFAGPPWKSIAPSPLFARVKMGPGNFLLAGTTDGQVFGGPDFQAPAPLATVQPPVSISGLGFGGGGVFYASTRALSLTGRVFRITCPIGQPCASEDISANLPIGEVMTLAGDPLAPESVLAAVRSMGIFRGVRTGTSFNWAPFSNGLPGGVTVTDMETTPNGQIVLTTFGRGTFRLHTAAPRTGTQTARGVITSFEEERADTDSPPGPNNPVIVTLTMDSQPGLFFSSGHLSGTTRTLLRNAFNNHRNVTIEFVKENATSARIIRAQ